MGLLDALLSNNTDGGGLLSFLQNNALNQQPAMGLPSDTAQYGQQPSYAPGQVQSQPPPIGNAPQSIPQQPPAPIMAQPQAAPQAAPDQSPGIGGRLLAGLQGLAAPSTGGLVGHLAGAVSGLAGQPTAANQTVNALISKGVDPATAQAAVGNPELMKVLITQAFAPQTHTSLGNGYIEDKNGKITRLEQDDHFKPVTVKNADGSESHLAFDPSTGSYSGAPTPPAGRFAVDDSLTGPARLDALRKADPDYARRIESMVNGDMPLPTGVAALKPNADRMIKDVLAVDGSTSASDFATRAATRKDYASGVASRVTKSLNTTIEHAGRLDEAIDKLNNHTYFPGITNWVHDKIGSNTDPEYQKAKSDFESAKEAFVKELDFTLSGGHSSVSGSAELRDKINRADSPEALHAAIQTDLHLLSARLDSHTKGFQEGTKSQRDPQDFLYPKNRPLFNKLMGSTDSSTGQRVPGVGADAAPSAAPSGTPSPGNYIWMPGKGLVPK